MAAPRVYRAVAATPVFRKTVDAGPTAEPKVFTTGELAPATADTVLVVTHESGAWWVNDDCAAGERRSCVTTTRDGGRFDVTVYAAGAGAGGTAQVALDGAPLVEGTVPFGGTAIDVDLPAGEYAVHTVHVVDGADDTVLLAFGADGAPLSPLADRSFDDAAGAVYALAPGARVVVGAYAPSTAGCTDVIINDCTGETPDRGGCSRDRDGDGLSDPLEAELGTDPDRHDSDGDGLFDYYEVIGRRADGAVEALARYGANPLRRDLFLELDRTPGAAEPDERTIRSLAAVLLDLPNLVSPDGSTGIQVHADIGAPCPNLPGVCGDFGGVDVFFPDTDDNSVSAYVSDPKRVRQHMSPARRGLFHYGMLTAGGGGQSGVGTTTLWAQFSESDKRARYPAVFIAHELGHSLGLQHWGASVEGGAINYQYAYPSLMNYAFQWGIPGATCGDSRFSRGALPTLDPTRLVERAVAPGVDKSQLANWPALLELAGADDVDFNRDGRIDDAPVVFDVAPTYVTYGGSDDWPDQVRAGPIGARVPTGGGALVVVPHDERGVRATTFAVFPFDHLGEVYPEVSMRTDTVGGDDGEWSRWSGGRPLPGGGLPYGEVAAASAGDRIVVVFPDAAGALWYATLDPARGVLSEWAPIPGWPAGARARTASAAAIAGGVTVVFRDLDSGGAEWDGDVYLARLDQDGWSAWERLALPSWTTPGIVEGPDGREYLAFVDSTGGFDGTIRFAYRAAGTTEPWTVVPEPTVVWSTGFDVAGLAPRRRTRVNLTFLPYHTAGEPSPEPFADGSGTLAVFWTKGPADEDGRGAWYVRRAYVEGYIDREGPAFAARDVKWRAQSRWRPYLDDSVAVARRFIDVVAAFPQVGGDAGCHRLVPIYLPHASGTPLGTGIAQRDTDDAAIIADTMCTALWQLDYGGAAACVCDGGLSVACAPAPDAEPDWPVCVPDDDPDVPREWELP
ncbi:MAG: hypothetical protein D6689_22370 [Deltaproteobacteria bacterium]|nr:MAG: hypothetical protein D6689_22370 [Deltaproteobacteria bacterium]